MKYLITILTIFFMLIVIEGSVFADPFLYCDPVENFIYQYRLEINEVEYVVPAQQLSNGTQRLKFDLAPFKDAGEISGQIRAENISGYSPWLYFSISIPLEPTGLRVK